MQSFAHFLRTLFLIAFSASMLVFGAVIDESRSAGRIVVRQTSTASTITAGSRLTEAQACAQYSRIANLSVIGANSSYRAAFLDSSPDGTLNNAAMMNKAIADHLTLIFDTELNAVCGNSSEIAIKEAAVNFTQNIVAQFTFVGNPSSIEVGPIIAIITGVCLMVFGTLTAL